MRSLAALVNDAVWPYDCPARRQARGILLTIAGTWALIVLGPVALGLALHFGGK